MKKRAQKDIWQGLYDFMLVESKIEKDPMELIEDRLPNKSWMEEVRLEEPSNVYRRKLTHQQITARFMLIEIEDDETLRRWQQTFELSAFRISEVHELPKPILIDNYLKADIF